MPDGWGSANSYVAGGRFVKDLVEDLEALLPEEFGPGRGADKAAGGHTWTYLFMGGGGDLSDGPLSSLALGAKFDDGPRKAFGRVVEAEAELVAALRAEVDAGELVPEGSRVWVSDELVTPVSVLRILEEMELVERQAGWRRGGRRGDDEVFFPDFLGIDIDSWDCDVVESVLVSGRRPRFLVVEVQETIPPPIEWNLNYHLPRGGARPPSDTCNGFPCHFKGCSIAYQRSLFTRFGYRLISFSNFDAVWINERWLRRVRELAAHRPAAARTPRWPFFEAQADGPALNAVGELAEESFCDMRVCFARSHQMIEMRKKVREWLAIAECGPGREAALALIAGNLTADMLALKSRWGAAGQDAGGLGLPLPVFLK